MRLIVLYKDGQRMECLDDIEQAHFYEDKVVTNKLPLNIRVIDFKKEDIASINCQDLNEDVVVRQKQEIEKLKQQLIEKEQALEDWEDGTIVEKLWHTQRQLAEKEKELHYKTAECEKWKTDYENCSKLEKMMTKERQYCLDNWRASDQDKISFCIEKLSRVRNRINSFKYDEIKCLNKKDAIEDCLEAIDNQIKQLKEKQDERN